MSEPDTTTSYGDALLAAAASLRGTRGGRGLGSGQPSADVVLATWRTLLPTFFYPGQFTTSAPGRNFIGAAQRGDSVLVSHPGTGAQIIILLALGEGVAARGDVMSAAVLRLQEYMRMTTNTAPGIWGFLAFGRKVLIFERDQLSGRIHTLRPEQTRNELEDGDGDESFDVCSRHQRTRLEDTLLEIQMGWKLQTGVVA